MIATILKEMIMLGCISIHQSPAVVGSLVLSPQSLYFNNGSQQEETEPKKLRREAQDKIAKAEHIEKCEQLATSLDGYLK